MKRGGQLGLAGSHWVSRPEVQEGGLPGGGGILTDPKPLGLDAAHGEVEISWS